MVIIIDKILFVNFYKKRRDNTKAGINSDYIYRICAIILLYIHNQIPCCNLDKFNLLLRRIVHGLTWYIYKLHNNYFCTKRWCDICNWTKTLFCAFKFHCIMIMIVLNVVLHPGAVMGQGKLVNKLSSSIIFIMYRVCVCVL